MEGPARNLDLLTVRLLENYGEQFPVSEWPTRLALDPVYLRAKPPEEILLDGSDGTEVSWFLTMLRTGGVFLLDPEQTGGAFAGQAPLMELPPLPFPRVVIEGHSLRRGPLAFMEAVPRDRLDYARSGSRFSEGEAFVEALRAGEGTLVEGGGPDVHGSVAGEQGLRVDVQEWRDERAREAFPGEHPFMDMLILSEVEPGQVWDIGMGYHFSESEEGGLCPKDAFLFSTDRVTPQGIVPKPAAGDPETDKFRKVSEFVRGLAVTAAHLIVADRVPVREWPVPRHQRKQMRRRGLEAPRVYFVDLAESGEIKPGRGEREYHVRWLVTGHWRLNPNGKTFVKHKGGVCSWVKPYVKGPAGAPWKGRPVHGRRAA
jgi:hypothetical protein